MNDLLSDLQADLAGPRPDGPTDGPTGDSEPAATAHSAAEGPPAAAVPPAAARIPLPSAPVRRTTPAFELRLTPLRWALPGLGFDRGLCLRVGPLQVGLTRR